MYRTNLQPTLRPLAAATLLAMTLGIAGCNSSGSGSGDETGSFTLRVGDAPVDGATGVWIEFTGVELKREGASPFSIDFETARSIELLATRDGTPELLVEGETIDAGEYEWVRLKVNAEQGVIDSYIEFPGEQHPLFIPSGAQTGLQLVSGFTVTHGGGVDFTIDIDLRRSIFAPPGLGGSYLLRPALRMVDTNEVGAIAGTVFPELRPADCSPGVYVYEGTDVEPGDIGGDGNEPLVSVTVDELGEYEIHYLAAGDYTVAYTCDSDEDDPDSADELAFDPVRNTEVTAGSTTTVDFGAD